MADNSESEAAVGTWVVEVELLESERASHAWEDGASSTPEAVVQKCFYSTFFVYSRNLDLLDSKWEREVGIVQRVRVRVREGPGDILAEEIQALRHVEPGQGSLWHLDH